MKNISALVFALVFATTSAFAQSTVTTNPKITGIEPAGGGTTPQVLTIAGIGATSTPGITTTNTTPATAGTPVQYGPAWVSCGTGYNSTSGLSETDCWRMDVRPQTIAGTTTSGLWFSRSINGGAYADQAKLDSVGNLILFNASVAPVGVSLVTGSGITMTGGIIIVATTVPSLSSGFGTGSALVSGRAYGFRWNVGSTATSQGVINLGATVLNGWNCSVRNLTANAAHRADDTVMIAGGVTTITVENQTKSTGAAVNWTAGDILSIACSGG